MCPFDNIIACVTARIYAILYMHRQCLLVKYEFMCICL